MLGGAAAAWPLVAYAQQSAKIAYRPHWRSAPLEGLPAPRAWSRL